jgi:hypothetical protein
MKLTSRTLKSPRFWRVSGLLAVDGVIFGLTDPQQVPSFVLAGGFVLLMVTLYQLVLALLRAASWYGLPGGAHRRKQARVLTGLMSGLIALQSIGELGPRDVFVLLPLALIAYLYTSYGKGERAPAMAPAESA